MPKCACGKTACFGQKGKSASCCAGCKMDDMINVVDALCLECDSRAIFNLPGKTGGIYCNKHKKDGTVNVKSKRCAFIYDNDLPCYTAPIYNAAGEQKGKFCVVHKEPDMVNVTGKRCEMDGCKIIAQYNFDGELRGKFCSEHKEEGMVDIKHRKCEFEGCSNQPSYKLETDSSCRFCATHKLEGMTNGKHQFCIIEGCKTIAGYNELGQKTPLYCSNHRKDGMIDVRHPLCIENGCDKRPIYNYKGIKTGLYCVTHKKEGMIDIISPRCKSNWCDSFSTLKYDYYCISCYINLFPDKPTTFNYKTKEKSVVDFVMTHFGNFTWISDKRVNDGCSRRRPDLLLDMGSHVLIVEVDENQHNDYDCSCENKRLMEISRDIGHRPLIFIRFNPDAYIDKNSQKISSCWTINKKCGVLYVPGSSQKDWNNRLDILRQQILYWIENIPEKTVEIVQLFYDGMIPT